MRAVSEPSLIRLFCGLVALGALLGAAGVLADELLQTASDTQTKSKLSQHTQPVEHNGPEVAPTPILVRKRRSASMMALPVAQQAAGLQQAYQQQQQQPPRDRLALARHELSDLITQAHRDKQEERRLMKMLINFKLASDLDDIAYPISANRLMLDDNNSAANIRRMQLEESATLAYPQQLEDLEDSGDDLSLAGFQLGKRREYIKPCMFNAVSCAKNPFKKY